MDDRALETLGSQAIRGWRGTVVDRLIARPLEKRTKYSAAQIRAAVGVLFFAYMTYRLGVALMRSARDARES